MMEPKDFILTRVEGEYAILIPVEGGDEVFIALALLPPEADIGTHLRCECLQYTVLDGNA